MQPAIPIVLSLIALSAWSAQAQSNAEKLAWAQNPWPAEPASEVRVVPQSDGSEVRIYKNAWGYEVQDYGGGKKSIIAPRNLVEAPGPGKPSADYYRGQGFVFIDRGTGDSLKRVGPCRYQVSYTPKAGEKIQREKEIGCLTEPTVRASVEAVEGGLRYVYTIRNGEQAAQKISEVQLDLPGRDAVGEKRGTRGWRALVVDRDFTRTNVSGQADVAVIKPVLSWSPYPLAGAELAVPPGGEIAGLSFTSAYLPALTESLVFGAPQSENGDAKLEGLPQHLNAALHDLLTSSGHVVRTTVGPQIPPPGDDPAARLAVFERLSSDVERALAAGLIDAGAADQVRGVIGEARAGLFDAETLEAAASKTESLENVDAGYKTALAVVLRALARS